MKPIRLSAHARERATQRGTTQDGIVAAIRDEPWKPTGPGRFEATKVLPYHAEWNGRYYAAKRVRPIFAEAQDSIVVVTVYTYYTDEDVDA